MLALKGLAVVVVIVSASTAAFGAPFVWNFQSPPTSAPSIQNVLDNNGGEMVVGDKMFTFFDNPLYITTSATVGTVAPGAAAITIAGVQVQGDYGLKFNGGWSAGGQEIADTTLTFKVSVIDPQLSRGFKIEDNALWISAYGVSGTGQGGIVSVSENVYRDDPNVTPPNTNASIANEFVYYRTDSDQEVYDGQKFTPATEIWVKKDIIANGGDLQTGSAHLSEFWQTFSQVPEPMTMLLLGAGALGLLKRRKK